MGFISYIIVQTVINVWIDTQLNIPESVVLIKPDYYFLGTMALFEFYFLFVARKYVQISTELLNDDDSDFSGVG